MKIIWNAAQQVAMGRLPHLRVYLHQEIPFDTWYFRWFVPIHTIPDCCPWHSPDVIPF